MEDKYNIVAPTRAELDLKDTEAVRTFVQNGKFDVIIHSANPNPVKSASYDTVHTMFEDSMRIFMNFYKVSSEVEKNHIYLGSGAEFDKTQEIVNICEEDVETFFTERRIWMCKVHYERIGCKK